MLFSATSILLFFLACSLVYKKQYDIINRSGCRIERELPSCFERTGCRKLFQHLDDEGIVFPRTVSGCQIKVKNT